jgi:hypothetical protein
MGVVKKAGWKRLGVIVGVLLSPLLVDPAAAQGASSPSMVRQAVVASPTPVRVVYPHELMTFRERFEMWRQMRAAKSPDERFELWAAKHAELEKRAAEQGVVLRDHGPMMMEGGMMDGGRMASGHSDGAPGRPPGWSSGSGGGGMMGHVPPRAW